MTRLELVRVSGRRLRPVSLAFEPGLHAVVAGPSDEVAELVAICAGVVRPRKGAVRLNGHRPFHAPETRRRIGALLEVEEPLEGPTVEAAVSLALTLHGSAVSAQDALAPLGLGALLGRPPASLSALELRSVALSIALSLHAPELLVLHEPFDAGLERPSVEGRLAERAAHGTIVLAMMASAHDAAALGASSVSPFRPPANVRSAPREARP